MRRRQDRAAGYEASQAPSDYGGASQQQGVPQQGTQQAAGQQQAGAAPGYTPQGRAEYGRAEYDRPEYRREGFLALSGPTVLAATLMILAGLLDFIEGLLAILRQGFFTVTTPSGTYLYQFNVHGWGWLQLSLGIALFAIGACVLLGQTWAKVLGIVLAVFSALASFMFLPYFPVWSIIVIAIDVFIIWALATSGRRAVV